MSTDTRGKLIARLEETPRLCRMDGQVHVPAGLWRQMQADRQEAARLLREDGEQGGPLSMGKRGPRPDAADVLAKLDAASAMVSALCKPRGTPGAREWLMSIPARPDHDPDLVIGDALHAARKLIIAHPDAGGEVRERVGAGPSAMLCEDNRRMREAGNALAEAALRVIRTYDGTHRLAIAVAEWAQAVADEGGRAALRGEEVGDG